ncbi:hypothetical protein BRC61_05480 [Halobacteriales archaeon QH_10_65_19]|nr:MAG: hypothetical protein BRC61_05480 [Halobacteriales archaeon QH_10_65_19]
MDKQWTDRLAGARMQVDQQFNDRVLNSQFSNQQWGLIMTAVEFEIENPDDPDRATLVANTEKLDQVLPELDKVDQGMGATQAGGGRDSSDGGFLDALGDLIPGMDGDSSGGGVDAERTQAATALTQEYATELQQYLEKQGRWTAICEVAAGTGDA